jgi:hypothetical protein
MIVAGSHPHKGDTSLPIGWRSAPQTALHEVVKPRITIIGGKAYGAR